MNEILHVELKKIKKLINEINEEETEKKSEDELEGLA